jgi:hypothetical protein
LRRLQRWIRMLRWVMGIAVFVPLADFLGGVDLVNLVRYGTGDRTARRS